MYIYIIIVSYMYVLCCAKLLQSCPTLYDPMDCNQPGFSACGILQARKLEWVVVLCPMGSPDPGIKPTSLTSPAVAGGFFTTNATWETPSYMCIFTQIYLYIY